MLLSVFNIVQEINQFYVYSEQAFVDGNGDVCKKYNFHNNMFASNVVIYFFNSQILLQSYWYVIYMIIEPIHFPIISYFWYVISKISFKIIYNFKQFYENIPDSETFIPRNEKFLCS